MKFNNKHRQWLYQDKRLHFSGGTKRCCHSPEACLPLPSLERQRQHCPTVPCSFFCFPHLVSSSIALAGLELTEIACLCLLSAGLKACTTTAWLSLFGSGSPVAHCGLKFKASFDLLILLPPVSYGDRWCHHLSILWLSPSLCKHC